MEDKRKPERSCIVCREKKYKNELIRLVCDGEKVIPDFEKKLPGRGAYICDDASCIEKLIKRKALNRAYRRQFSEETYKCLEEAFGRRQR